MIENDKLASENATVSSMVKNVRLYMAKALYNIALSFEPQDKELLVDMKMKVSELIGEIVPVEINCVLAIATERFLMTDLNLTFEESTKEEKLFFGQLYHRMVENGFVSGMDEFRQMWDEASELLQQIDIEIGGPII